MNCRPACRSWWVEPDEKDFPKSSSINLEETDYYESHPYSELTCRQEQSSVEQMSAQSGMLLRRQNVLERVQRRGFVEHSESRQISLFGKAVEQIGGNFFIGPPCFSLLIIRLHRPRCPAQHALCTSAVGTKPAKSDRLLRKGCSRRHSITRRRLRRRARRTDR